MLFLVGVGLSSKDLTYRAVAVCKKSHIFVDKYTSFIDDKTISAIKRFTRKEIKTLSRSDLEENAERLVQLAKSENVAILVGGDPLIATTHKILFLIAKKSKVRIEVVHASSVFTAVIGESGLDFYRFGKVATIPSWSAHYSPKSFYETIKTNIQNNLHSLLLLDYNQENKTSLDLKEAIRILEEAKKSYKDLLINDNTEILIAQNIASRGSRFIRTKISTAKRLPINKGLTAIIIPAKLTDIERESVKVMLE